MESTDRNLENRPKDVAFFRATVSFTDKDLERVEKLKRALGLKSTSQAISYAIKIADTIREQRAQGNDILFEKDGRQKQMIIPGL